MSDFSALNTAISGLLAHRRASEVIGQNIANVNTEGYSRQRVGLTGSGSSIVPAFWSRPRGIGDGVVVGDVTRSRDEFLERRTLVEQGSSSNLGVLTTTMKRIEAAFPEPLDTGMAAQLSEFWQGWDDVGNNPSSLGARSQLLERATSLSQSFNRTASQIDDLRESTIGQLKALVEEANGHAARIADLNGAIRRATASGITPNDLLDQRDQLVSQLSKLVGASVRDGEFGQVDVMIGGNQLVTADRANLLKVDTGVTAPSGSASEAVGWSQVALRWQKDDYPMTLSGGEAMALATTVNDVLPRYLDKLNSAAVTLTTQVNAIHETGYGLNDVTAPNRDFFEPLTGKVNAARTLGLSAAVSGHPEDVAASDGTGRLNASIAQKLAQEQDSATGADAEYRSLISSLGVESQTTKRRSAIQDQVTMQIDTERRSASGVNLDEEMVALTAAQHAYSASARLMTAIDGMLETLIKGTGLVGR